MMDNSKIWWKMINNPRRLVSNICKALLEEKSVIIGDCNFLPFHDDFKKSIEDKLSKANARRSINYLNANNIDSSINIEDFFFENYCSIDTQRKYFPKKGYSKTQFLLEQKDFLLNDKFVWVSNIDSNAVSKWADFISKYCRLQKTNNLCAVFVIEFNSNFTGKIKNCIVENYKSYVSEYDYYIYSMLMSANSDIDNKRITNYAAEISSMLCANNAEYCEFLMSDIYRIINDTANVYSECMDRNIQESELNAVIWNAQIKHLFPIIESYRRDIVEKYGEFLKVYLPYKTNYGVIINELSELDLCNILDIMKKYSINITKDELNKLHLYKDARNDLAHLKPTNNKNLFDILDNFI